MKGKLYGIGTGPGDPELLTIKAVKTIHKCGVIAVPETGNGERTAFSIIKEYAAGKELLECRFAMEHDMAKRREARQSAADGVARILNGGVDVGFITLGDPTTYSTYMYVHEIIVSRGFEAEIIPGVTSYAAAAAALGVALCKGGETLTLIAGHDKELDGLLRQPGNKVIMKSGAGFTRVLGKLKEHGYAERTSLVCRAAMDGQRLYRSIEDYENLPEADYFTIAIVKEHT